MSDDNVRKFTPVIVGDGIVFDADRILKGAEGNEWIKLAVLGVLKDGTVCVMSTHGDAETVLLIEQAKHVYLSESFEKEPT